MYVYMCILFLYVYFIEEWENTKGEAFIRRSHLHSKSQSPLIQRSRNQMKSDNLLFITCGMTAKQNIASRKESTKLTAAAFTTTTAIIISTAKEPIRKKRLSILHKSRRNSISNSSLRNSLSISKSNRNSKSNTYIQLRRR